MSGDPGEALLSLPDAVCWRETLRRSGKKLVVTNGCFDLMHRGHAAYLAAARREGDALLVLLNSDDSVRALKGASRPINCETDRAYMLGALASVDRVVIFDGSRCQCELAELAPDVYVKAGDYTLDRLDPGERGALEKVRAKIVFMPFVAGCSTTSIIDRIVSGRPGCEKLSGK